MAEKYRAMFTLTEYSEMRTRLLNWVAIMTVGGLLAGFFLGAAVTIYIYRIHPI